jgi:MFS family permease
VQAVSAPVAVVVNAVAFGVSALSLRRIDVDRLHASDEATSPAAASARPGRREIAEGLRHAVGNRYIRALLGEATTFNLFNEVFIIGLLLWAVRDLDLSPAAIGIIFTAGGLGSFLGAWFGSRVTGRFGYGPVLLITMAVGNSAPLGTALADGAGEAALFLLCSVFLLIGVGSGIANVHAVSLRQTTLPEQLRGRVNAAYRLISWGVVPLGAAAGGILAGRAGAQVTMIVGAAGIAASTLWVAFSAVPRLRTIGDAADHTRKAHR